MGLTPRPILPALAGLAFLAASCRAGQEGLRGLTLPTDDPPCAFACTGSLASFPLSCSVEDHSGGGGGHGHGSPVLTKPSCRANDEAYLRTVAYCMKTKCEPYEIPVSILEQVWELKVTGAPDVPAKWSYTAAFLSIESPPTRQLLPGDTLNTTSLAPASWQTSFNTASVMANESRTQSIYGLVLLLVGAGLPILLTITNRLPSNPIGRLVRKYITYPSFIPPFQVRPLPYLIGNAPTIGQTLFVFVMVVLNVVTTATGYRTVESHNWLRTPWQQIVAFLMYRTGVLSYAMAPLVILFAGRNNILLLWLTDWSHSTYLLLHRWMARLFVLQALLHSVLAVVVYKDMGIYAAQAVMDYWSWGVAATVIASIMLVVSSLWFRRQWYEIFLVGHIAMAVLVLVGSWYHVALRFPDTGGGFNTWIYVAVAIWVFDRVARLARIIGNGARRAVVTDLGSGYLRVDVAGVRWGPAPGKHAYVHFPTVNPLRPWESHPFSVLPRSLFRAKKGGVATPDELVDAEKGAATQTITASGSDAGVKTTAGITLFVRKAEGMTKVLKSSSRLLTFLDGPYPNNSASALLDCDRLLLVAGGIGITGLLAWVDNHTNARLCWSIKESAQVLVSAMDPVIGRLDQDNVQIRVGQRFNPSELLDEEAQAGWAKIGVVVCGPGGLCDDARAAVVAAGKKYRGTEFVLEVEAYSW
ncbi:hypothetical protein OQA88_9407 [Cercophora sp. LCS_1]